MVSSFKFHSYVYREVSMWLLKKSLIASNLCPVFKLYSVFSWYSVLNSIVDTNTLIVIKMVKIFFSFCRVHELERQYPLLSRIILLSWLLFLNCWCQCLCYWSSVHKVLHCVYELKNISFVLLYQTKVSDLTLRSLVRLELTFLCCEW